MGLFTKKERPVLNAYWNNYDRAGTPPAPTEIQPKDKLDMILENQEKIFDVVQQLREEVSVLLPKKEPEPTKEEIEAAVQLLRESKKEPKKK